MASTTGKSQCGSRNEHENTQISQNCKLHYIYIYIYYFSSVYKNRTMNEY